MAAMHELPTMAAQNYSNASYNTQELMGGVGSVFISNGTSGQNVLGRQAQRANDQMDWQAHLALLKAIDNKTEPQPKPVNKKEAAMPSRRIVQVYIADPSEDVPLKDSVLYTGEQKMTDLTDQELFFEIDIKSILEAHNANRAKIINKKIKERTEYLEPVKVRDLKMVVVTVAEF